MKAGIDSKPFKDGVKTAEQIASPLTKKCAVSIEQDCFIGKLIVQYDEIGRKHISEFVGCYSE